MYEIAAGTSEEKREEYLGIAKRYDEEAKQISEDAKHLEEQSHELNHEGDHHEHNQHILTVAVTLLHVSIAIATISIIAKGAKWPWFIAIALAVAGIATTASTYLQ